VLARPEATERRTPDGKRGGRRFNVTSKNRANLTGWAFAAPGMLVLMIMMVIPILTVLYDSFFVNIYATTSERTFVGFENFRSLVEDDFFWSAASNTAIVVVFRVILTLGVGLMLAIALNQPFNPRVRGVIRSVVMLPWLLASSVVAAIGVLILAPLGIVNSTLSTLGIAVGNQPWLGQTSTALWAVILWSVWRGFPFVFVMLLAGLQSVPRDLLEAALVDGARPSQRLRYVTLPHLRGVIFVVALLETIWTMRLFDLVYVMTGGGPLGSTHVLATMIYEISFRDLEFGRASAAAIVLLVLSLIVAVLYLWLERRGDRGQAVI